jgi:hypothetical protein
MNHKKKRRSAANPRPPRDFTVTFSASLFSFRHPLYKSVKLKKQ